MKKSRPSYPQLSAPIFTYLHHNMRTLVLSLLHPSLAQANVSDGLKHLQGANGSRIEDESANDTTSTSLSVTSHYMSLLSITHQLQ